MPELPEVQTVVSQLKEKVIGKKIIDVEIRKKRLFQGRKEDVVSAGIVGARRRAKMVCLDLDNGFHLLFHLKMSGQIIFRDDSGRYGGGHPIPNINKSLPNKMTHIIFKFADGSKLFFNEQRQFGWIKVLDDRGLKKEFDKYGIEPFSKEFTYNGFLRLFKKRKRSKIKQVLLDQKLVCGIGNIYASEICFEARVMPDRLVGDLSSSELKRIYDSIRPILKKAIDNQGTSMDLYVNLDGSAGNNEEYLKVYAREGQVCKIENCFGTVKKIKLGGRGTFYCDNCQK